MAEDLRAKYLAEAGYLGPKARAEAQEKRAAENAAPQPRPDIQHHGTMTGRFPPSKLGFGRVSHTVYPVKYMVAVGDLSKGFQFYGPFTEDKFAARWAYNNFQRGTDYRVYPIFDVREDA